MGVLLDTNLLSELLRPKPEPKVLAWFAAQAPSALFVSSVTQAEMLLGAALLPRSARRSRLEAALQAMFSEDFEGRLLPFGPQAAPWFAELVSARRRAGRPLSQFDGQIAAIARAHRLALATRNTPDFEGCGLQLLNPWMDRP